jgi:5-(carboxyamino)imidazole ribonucleotide synthase
VRAALVVPRCGIKLVTPAAAMVNLLGTRDAPARPAGLAAALAVPGAHVHLYGKRRSRLGRKMGHVTALGATVDEAARLAMAAASCITI